MGEILEISASLWLVVPNVHPDHDDGLVTLRDDTGGDTLIDRTEIPALIAALQQGVEGKENAK